MRKKLRIVLLEDRPVLRKEYQQKLEELGRHPLNQRFGYKLRVEAAAKKSDLLPFLADRDAIDLAILDQRIQDWSQPVSEDDSAPELPEDEQGEAALTLLHDHRPHVRQIVIATQETVLHPEAAKLALGADEYWFKNDLGGNGLTQQVARILALPSQYSLEHLRKAIEKSAWLSDQNWTLERVQEYLDQELVGDSVELLKAKFQICEAALSDVPVLITGESGCGKEVVARTIHRLSCRGDEQGRLRPYSLNCAEFLNENMLHSELFGHGKGAFTGADKEKTGLFFLANGSTLFLDEVGLATKAFQHFLLRALEEKQARPLGEGKKLPFDVRIIAATDQSVVTGSDSPEFFSRALLFRLCGVHIEISPLRKRPRDVRPLIEHFKEQKGFDGTITEMAHRFLETYPWPGNVRQLKTVLEVLIKRCELTDQKFLSQYDFEMYLPLAHHEVVAKTPDFRRYQTGGAILKDVEARFSADFVHHEHQRLTDGEKSDLAYERTARELDTSVTTIKSRLRDHREFFPPDANDDS